MEKLQPPGIEPGSNPWEGSIMPLDHGCYCCCWANTSSLCGHKVNTKAPAVGIEPTTSGSGNRRASIAPRGLRLESRVAQWSARWAHNPQVVGSKPTVAICFFLLLGALWPGGGTLAVVWGVPVCAAGPYVTVRSSSPMNGLGTSCDAEVSKPPANARKGQGTRVVG